MTDQIPTPENVTELKPRQKPGPKPKAAPAPKPVEAPLVPSGSNVYDGIPFRGSHNPENARAFYADQAEGWRKVNVTRDDEGVLGIDAIIIELAFKAAANGDVLTLMELGEAVESALVAVSQ